MAIQVKNQRNYKGPGEYVGRPSPLGNPFKIGPDGTREQVIHKYQKWLDISLHNESLCPVSYRKVTDELHRLLKIYQDTGSLVLICWCHPASCHGEIIAQAIKDLDIDPTKWE